MTVQSVAESHACPEGSGLGKADHQRTGTEAASPAMREGRVSAGRVEVFKGTGKRCGEGMVREFIIDMLFSC